MSDNQTYRSLSIGTLIRRAHPMSRAVSDRMGSLSAAIERTYPHVRLDGRAIVAGLIEELRNYR